MALDFSQEIEAFEEAAHGEDVRSAMVSMAEEIEEQVNDALDNQLLTVDDTLTQSGSGADAKIVGDALWGPGQSHENRTPTPFVNYTASITKLVDLPIGSWKMVAVGTDTTSGTLKAMLGTEFPWKDSLGGAAVYYRVTRVRNFADGRCNITIDGLSGGPRYVGQIPANATADSSITWTNRSATSDFTLTGALALAKPVGDLIFGDGVSHDQRVPDVQMRFTGINSEGLTIADIPDNCHFSIRGDRFLELFDTHSEEDPAPFQFEDEIGSSVWYYLEKKKDIINHTHTVYMFTLYRLPRQTVYAGYISMDGAQVATNVKWNKIIAPVDASLTQAGSPADAKAVRDLVESGGMTVSILVFGNSYSFSDLGLLPALLKEFGVAVTLGLLYQGGCKVSEHIDNIENDSAYTYYCECNGIKWTNTAANDTTKPSAVLAKRHWDYIVIQQPTAVELGIDQIGEMADLITAQLDYPVSFLYNQCHIWGANDTDLATATIPGTTTPIPGTGGEQKSNEQFLVGADFADQILAGDTVLHVLPCGAAVQNARQLDVFKAVGSVGYLCYDQTSHLQNGIATLIPAYAAALKICDILGIKQKIFASQITPSDTWLNQYGLFTAPGGIVSHGSCAGVSDANKILAARCAIMAWKHPSEITGYTPVGGGA